MRYINLRLTYLLTEAPAGCKLLFFRANQFTLAVKFGHIMHPTGTGRFLHFDYLVTSNGIEELELLSCSRRNSLHHTGLLVVVCFLFTGK